ncbi:ricin-type beta-trefoil lectin domain protein [Actinoplanes sp. URMC 104]|uniref:ricin-type beta-trefoil lectin domain protein n=1 Tax=Actinoplanes sp. URMC 104 TaxID=3423409 RepID=UPI003F1A930B
MTDGDLNDEQDPLLVRPFVLRESASADDGADATGDATAGAGADATGDATAGAGADASDDGTVNGDEAGGKRAAQKWPAAAGREVRSGSAVGGDDAPTAILHLPFRRKHGAPVAPGNRRRRLAVLAGAAAVVVLGAAATGYAALRDDVRPSVATGVPGPIPAATGPAASSAVAPSASGGATAGEVGNPGGPGGLGGPGAPGGPSSSGSATPSTPGSAGASAAVPVAPSTSATAGEPISLSPEPTEGSRTDSPRAPEGLAPAPPADDRAGVVRGQNGLCLDLNGAVAVDGNHVQVYDCNQTAAQSWTLASDGTLRVLGKCALVVGDRSVKIVSCDGRTTAQWRASGQLLINVSNNDCLTDPSAGRTSGTAVTVTSCSGSASQRWSLP